MGDKTAIEWTDHTFNPWWGCAKVSPGCDHCYAEAWAKRTGTAPWGIDTPRRSFGDKHWNEPLKWDTAAAKAGRHDRVFCASMADVFDKNAPAGARERLWKLIDDTPNLDWQLLTKRIGNVGRMVPQAWLDDWPVNAWLGISVVNQEEANRDIPKLLALPVRVRFLSCEPLLGPLTIFDLDGPIDVPDGSTSPLHWVISGGESGAQARPSHPEWHRSLRDQCAAVGVPFLFKQWGEWAPGECGSDIPMTRTERVATYWADEWIYSKLTPTESINTHRDDGPDVHRFGKKAAGRRLDGVTHDGYPA